MKRNKTSFTKILSAFALVIAAFSATLTIGGTAFADTEYCHDIDGENAECEIHMTTFGYGRFDVHIEGTGMEGFDEDSKVFYYYPAYAELVKDGDKYYVDTYYHWDDLSDAHTGDVAKVEIKVYYPGSDEEVVFSPIDVPLNASGVSRVELPFAENGLTSGDYKIEVYAYNRDDLMMTEAPYTFTATYTAPANGTNALVVPDTGGLFGGINITTTDYLITELIIFGIVAVAGVMFIVGNDKRHATIGGNAKKGKYAKNNKNRGRKASNKTRRK